MKILSGNPVSESIILEAEMGETPPFEYLFALPVSSVEQYSTDKSAEKVNICILVYLLKYNMHDSRYMYEFVGVRIR